jgi:hypothetical protein
MPWYGGIHREGLLSGIGPWALTRLALQTGGSFTILDQKEDQGPFKLENLKRYFPNYGSLEEYMRAAQSTPLRKAVSLAIAVTWHPTYRQVAMSTPAMAYIVGRADRHPFQITYGYVPPFQFRQQLAHHMAGEVLHCRNGAIVIEQALKQFGEEDLEEEYAKEPSPRWRAWYDLNRGRLLAMSVRHREYELVCKAILNNLGALKPDTNRIVLHPSDKYQSGPEIESRAREALRLLTRCLTENAETPWAYLAQWELDHMAVHPGDGLGLSVEEVAIPAPPPPRPSPPGRPVPTPTPPPAPTFTIPKL